MMDDRKTEELSMNELRARLYEAGIEYSDNTTREELIQLVKQYC